MNKFIQNFPEECKKKRPIFASYEILDWYDGAILGIGELNESHDFYLFEMVAYDLKSKERVFELVKLELSWVTNLKANIVEANPKFIQKAITQLYSNYKEEAYLLKSKDINDWNFNLIEIDPQYLEFYKDIEAVLNQSKNSLKRWFEFFC